MSHRKTMLAASIFAGLCLSGALYAQDTTQTTTTSNGVGALTRSQDTAQSKGSSADSAKQLATITVTGIRASLQASMDTKRNADAIVDAITAEDIGKFPTTNAAEALAQIPGVTLDRSIPGTQRVSIDGMDPSLNVSLLDGHPIAQAIWLFGDNPNRGFNYSQLPTEILGQIEVLKSPEARIVEGSLGGTVLMHTVQPLDVAPNTVSGSFGVNYNDMVGNQRPNGSVFYSWHNADKTFGVDVSAGHQEQFTSREGMENYGYTSVSTVNTAALAAGNTAIQNELNAGTIKGTDQIPNQLSAANFQQTEKRNSILVNLQYRPNQNFESTVSLMYMKDSLNNVNQSLYPWATNAPGGITSLTEGANGIIVAGTQVGTPCYNTTTCKSTAATFADNYARQSMVTTKGVDWKATYFGDGWRLAGQAGVSSSSNPMTSFIKEIYYGGGFDWNINNGVQFTDPSSANNPNYWADNGWGGNEETILYKARDTYGQLDFSKDLDGFVNEILVGARYASHWESQTENAFTGPQQLTLNQIGYGGLTDLAGASALGLTDSFVTHVQTSGLNAIKNAVLSTPGFGTARDANVYFDNTWAVQQQNSAAYLQANFGTDNVHGNLGIRFVHTEFDSSGYNVPSACSAADTFDCYFPNGFGWVTSKTSYNNWLPSVNVAWNVAPDFIVRGAASETISYAPFNQMAPYFEANDTVLTGAGGNPNLKPYRSANFDASAEWYFNDESMFAASVFYKDVLNYIVNAATTQTRINGSWTLPGYLQSEGNAQIAAGLCTSAGVCQYDVTAPVNGGRAKVKGATLSYQQAFGDSGFGLRANYTYSDGSTHTGGWLPYNSKDAYTIAPYFEKGPYSASVSYNYRSAYLAGGYVAGAASTYVDGFKELDASAAYQVSKNFSVSLDMLNLLNSKYYAYLGSKTQLSEEYVTGRQFMLEAHFKF
ncbi:TonB-dependent receptor [Dyella acidiphila]|uniref:TonB-dependent receptor n=1 Tax=Dyella acidiphila TaxID=2775866 RepID=A0ABR9G6C8_9GAMM|nr:TonB-dependent receptor [Dyella acidiphila]MBE1159568.1 TonB-dependent receptor [Dyella acidiphila]